MFPETNETIMKPTSTWQHLILPAGVLAAVLVILCPISAGLMDLLLAANITVAVVILLTALSVQSPLEFDVFPVLLLGTTWSRLVLNIASTRLILGGAEQQGLDSAGAVIRTFGEFVTGDQIAIGLILFAIIMIVQFVVITKGASRISEVAARFALDGLPGRQAAIEAEAACGSIDHEEAAVRREALHAEADFLGSMDGASKFVRGDAIAGLIITAINIAGGLLMGIGAGMSFREAGEVFAKLTVGDGLASQIPALLISLAAGVLITRGSRAADLSIKMPQQLFQRPQVMLVAAGFLCVLLFTQLPAFPLLGLASLCAGLAVLGYRRQQAAEFAGSTEEAASDASAPEPVPAGVPSLAIEPLAIELGLGLLKLADPGRGGRMLEHVADVRTQLAEELGLLVPQVKIRDDLDLPRFGYQFRVAGHAVAEGTLPRGVVFLRGRGSSAADIAAIGGERVRLHPALPHDDLWQIPLDAEAAVRELPEVTPLRAVDVLRQHFLQTVRCFADELLTRELTRHLVEQLRATAPALVEELVPDPLSIGEIQRVLQLLLREEIPIRHLEQVLEAMGQGVRESREPRYLAELARRRLARTICSRLRTRDRRLPAVLLAPRLEERLRQHLDPLQETPLRLPLDAADALRQSLLDACRGDQGTQVLLVSPELRWGVKRLTQSILPGLHVLSHEELTTDTQIEIVRVIRDDIVPPARLPLAA